MCFASSNSISAAYRDGLNLNTPLSVGSVDAGYEIAGVVASENKVYALSKSTEGG